MSLQSYLIDTNILIGLEDNAAVQPAYSKLLNLAAKHGVSIYVHEAAREDIARDKDPARKTISLSKIEKYRILAKRQGLTPEKLREIFGPLNRPNDIVDATILHALLIDAADFLVTQDIDLHARAQKHSMDLARRVLFVSDAVDLLIQTYEPKEIPVRHVADVEAHTIDHQDSFFDSLRGDYPEFDEWWIKKCVKQRRACWVVYDNGELAGLVVRKDEAGKDTDAVTKANRILKICTFKVRPEKRGIKLGELLLKQILWYAQKNGYELTYLTTYEDQVSLINLLEFFGFKKMGSKEDGELIYERRFTSVPLVGIPGQSDFDAARLNYPRFLMSDNIRGFGIPIQEEYHDTLYPELWRPRQPDLFDGASKAEAPTRPGNTIRKVYLCRAQSKLSIAGSILFFYKSASKEPPSQAITTLGILEEVTLAISTKDLMLKTGGRSVYSEEELDKWGATPQRPVKVINYLLVGYIDPPISLPELRQIGVVKGNPQQSIYEISKDLLRKMVSRSNLGIGI